MILVDSMIWMDHLHRPIAKLAELLDRRAVLMHDFVLAEIALGSIARREATLDVLWQLPSAVVADHLDVMNLITGARLFGTGVGYVDAHLLASAMLLVDVRIWTRDKRLEVAATRLDLAVPSPA